MFIRTTLGVTLAAILAAAATSAVAGSSSDPSGPWLTGDGKSVIQIAACGPALCGTIVSSQAPLDAKGRPLCGRTILGDMVQTSADSWGNGWIYNPKTGAQYPVTLNLAADGKLRLHISAGSPGLDFTWTRPPQAVAACTP